PVKPPDPVPFEPVRLPTKLTEFGRLNEHDLNAFAQSAKHNKDVAEAFGRLAQDLDLETKQTVEETVAGVHGALRDYKQAVVKKLEKAATKQPEGFIGLARKTAKQMAKYAAARKFDIGGPMGAVTRTAAGAGIGYAMDGAEGAVLGAQVTSAMVGAKAGVRG